MKTFIKKLWAIRYTVAVTWLFFFCVSLAGKTPHTIFVNFLISGTFSILMCAISLLVLRYKK